ncbi:MAG TPA: tetratricopeptide repeat protein [Desulfobulbaceae bacterium]|nr:tetratricopeptide repeat protein [Desulfobulbaceae bacterium]
MANQSAFDPNHIKETAVSETSGLLDELNLPPAFIDFLRKNQRTLWFMIAVIAIVVTAVSLYGSYRTYRENKATAAMDAAMQADSDHQVDLLNKVVQDFTSTPTEHWARIELAQISIKNGKPAEAILQLQKVNKEVEAKNPLKPLVLFKLAGLYEETKNYQAALARYQELTAVSGFEADARYALGRVYAALHKNAEAVTAYQQYLSLTEKSPAGERGQKRALVEYMMKELE